MPTLVVLTSPDADERSRDALARALERFPARIETAPRESRAQRLCEVVADPDVAWACVVDADVVVRPDAFGGLRRTLDAGPAIVGGRALVGNLQRFGAMLAAPRAGPEPFEIVPLFSGQADRVFADAMRGPIDVPQRGLFLVAANFMRDLNAGELDDDVLFLDLAVRARVAGRSVLCEPSLAFSADDDSVAVRRGLAKIRRYSAISIWRASELHRDPPGLRNGFVNREVRVMGDVRGFDRRPVPPIDVLVTADDEVARARAVREARNLRPRSVTAVAPADGNALRSALGRTGDRYLLVASAATMPSRAVLDVLAERLEATSRCALALESAVGAGAALFHLGRIVNAASLAGDSVRDVVAAAIAELPARRLFAADADGAIVPETLLPLAPLRSVEVILVAASRPEITGQTLQALVKDRVEGRTSIIYPAGSGTTERWLKTYAELTLVADESDPHLALGLNRTLAAVRSEGVLIVRDDVQVSLGFIPRLRDAFRRIPRLGIAVPRVGGSNRPEALPDLGYRNSGDMQSFADRRAEAFAREAMLMDLATAPVLLTTREVLELVGGFDERFAFTRVGIEDFARRFHAANFRIARCDDAYAHIFPPSEAMSFLASIDDDPALRAAYEARWANRHGFDPAGDRIAFRRTVAPVPALDGRAVRVLVPVGTEQEWASVKPFLADLAAAFRASDPLNVFIGLDGEFGLQTAVNAIREILAAAPVPLEETLNIRVEPIGDIATWRDAGENVVRVAAIERDALSAVPAVDGSTAVRARFSVATA